jgi:dTDP-glucose 4,6-dehydratase
MENKTHLLQITNDDLDHIINSVGSRWNNLKNQHLLLTGCTGFIGKWLLASFLYANKKLKLGAHVVAVSRNPQAFLEKFPELNGASEITWISSDVRNLTNESIHKCSFAIHGATDVIADSTPANILDTCITGTHRVLHEFTKEENIRKRVLLLSSGAVYGPTPPKMKSIPEDWLGGPDTLKPSSAYGEGKRVSELLGILATVTNPKLEVSIARCFAFVGPHLSLNKQFAIGNFIDAAIQKKSIKINSDGTAIRSYLYAADLAYWLWTMLFEAPSGQAYNVGGSEIISIEELAQLVNHVLNNSEEIDILKTQTPNTTPHIYVPTIHRIQSELGLYPTINLDDAILRTANWASQYC